MKVPELFTNLDFTRFFPVQHKRTEAYFAIDVTENMDFDIATHADRFFCYRITDQNHPATLPKFIFTKAELQPVPLLL